MNESKIAFIINRVKDPDNVERFRLVLSFEDVLLHSDLGKEALQLQEAYTKLIENCKAQLEIIKANKKNSGDPILKWRLAATIYDFLQSVEKRGYYFVNASKTLSRDLGISVRQINYLIEFIKTYPKLEQVRPEISWDKYKELLDVKDHRKREVIFKKLLNGELRTREDIRKFKKELLR